MILSTFDERQQTNSLNGQVHYCPSAFDDYKLGHVGDGCTLCMELKLLELLKEDLIRKTAQLRVKINQTHSVINRQLPPEILASIFQAYVDDPSYDDPLSEVEPLQYSPTKCNPLLLGAVCRTWRDIAWSTPRLWASITINLDFPHNGQATKMLLIQEWLSRAGQLPLSIRLVDDSSQRHDDITQVRPIIDLVNRYSPRWQSLIIHLPTCMFPWFATIGNQAPLLKYLEVEGKHHFRNNDSRWGSVNLDTLNLGHTPSLNYLSMRRISLCQLKLDWDSLTSFSGENLSDLEGLEVLRRAPLLVHGALHTTSGSEYITDRYTLSSESKPIVAHHLRTFSLTFQNQNGLTFMENVTCPALDTLSIVGPPMASLPSFFLRSGFALKSLSLKFCGEQAMCLVGLLHSQPSLVELSVGWSPLLNELLAELTTPTGNAKAEDSVFLPNLEKLEFFGAANFNWEQFGDLFPAPSASQDILMEDAATESSTIAIKMPEGRLQRFLRPWRHITMTLIQDGEFGSAGRGVPYIPEPVLARLRLARASGVAIDVNVPTPSDSVEMRDWIIFSKEWHDVQREIAALKKPM